MKQRREREAAEAVKDQEVGSLQLLLRRNGYEGTIGIA